MQKYYLIAIPLIFAVLLSGSYIDTSISDIISNDANGAPLNALSLQSTVNNVVTIIITGIVKTCTSGDPFEGVTVTVNSLNGELLGTTTTDSNGFYTIIFQCTEDMLQSMDYTFHVTASYPGHTPRTADVTVTQNPKTPTDSSLSTPTDLNYYGTALLNLGDIVLKIGSWNKIGIDHNKPATDGPNATQVQVHITNTNTTTTFTNLWALFTWTNGTNTNIALNSNETSLKYIGNLSPGQTLDAYWLAEAIRNKAADQYTRGYTVYVWGDNLANTTINDTLTVQIMRSQSRNSITSISCNSSSIHNGDIITVMVNASTSSSGYVQTYLPGAQYNPAVVKPINVTITFTNSSGTYTTTDTNIYYSTVNYYTIYYTYQIIGVGSSIISTTVEDHTQDTNENYHYNSDYGKSGTYINITSDPSADVGVKTAILPASCPGQAWPPILGQYIFFQINATNYGPDNATGINITDLLNSSQVTYKDYSLSTDGGLTWTLSKNLATSVYNNNTGIWNVGNLTKGQTSILMIRTTLKQNNTTLYNNATITGNTTYDPNTANNNATSSVYVPG